MTANDVKCKLDQAIDEFSQEIHAKYPENSQKPVTEADINELARNVSYLAADFRDAIFDYLKQNET